MDSVIGTNEARHAEKPGRIRVRCTGAGFPLLATRVRVSVECGGHHAVRYDRWRTQVQGCLSTCGGAADCQSPGRRAQVDPAALFVPLSRVARKRIRPGLFQRLLDHRIIQEVRGCRCLHSPFRFRGGTCRSPIAQVESSGARSRVQRRLACCRGGAAGEVLAARQKPNRALLRLVHVPCPTAGILERNPSLPSRRKLLSCQPVARHYQPATLGDGPISNNRRDIPAPAFAYAYG
jgi:hypothetical protein